MDGWMDISAAYLDNFSIILLQVKSRSEHDAETCLLNVTLVYEFAPSDKQKFLESSSEIRQSSERNLSAIMMTCEQGSQIWIAEIRYN